MPSHTPEPELPQIQATPPTQAQSESQSVQASPKPGSLSELFTTFALIAMQGFGGVLTIIQREIVDKRRWLTQKEFTEDWAVSQILPGGNVVNLCIILGNRYFGWQGVLAALSGLLLPPMLLILILATAYNQFVHLPQVEGAVRGMGAAAAGLIGAASIKMLRDLKSNDMGVGVCAALSVITFAAVGLLRWPLVYVVLGLGVPALGFACWKIARSDAMKSTDAESSASGAGQGGAS